MKKIWNFLKRLFRNMKALAERYVKPSVLIVEGLKRAVDSPVADLITAIIPGHLDNSIVASARIHLPRILKILRISEECLQLDRFEDIVQCAVTKLREYDDAGRAAQYHSIAAMLSVSLSDKKITWREAIHLAEEIFQEIKK